VLLDWIKVIETLGSLGLLFYLFVRYLPSREEREREERERRDEVYAANNQRLMQHCQSECDQFREESRAARQQFTDTLLKMLESHESSSD
jgi:hypothetical protein